MGKVLNAAQIGYKFNTKILKISTCNSQKVPAYSEIISISLSTKGDKVLHGF
jgi:hypothetical protein